jgi:uncharacterized protein
MIAVDTNLLVYAHRRDSPWHERANSALTHLAEGPHRWALPWQVIHEFFGIVTHPRIYSPPSTTQQAIAQLDAWLEAPTVELIGEDSGYWKVLRLQLERGHIAGPRVHDARIAAICLYHGVTELWTADRDFTRFPSLSVRNPLAEP